MSSAILFKRLQNVTRYVCFFSFVIVQTSCNNPFKVTGPRALAKRTPASSAVETTPSPSASPNPSPSPSPSPSPVSDLIPPQISGITLSNLSSSSITISWTTDELSSTQIEYGLTTTYGSSSPFVSNLTHQHTVTLLGLSAATRYNYRVKSQDAARNLGSSTNQQFTTSPGSVPPVTGNIIDVNPGRRFQTITGWEGTGQVWHTLESNIRTNQSRANPLYNTFQGPLFDQLVNKIGINRVRLEINSGVENPVDYFSQYLSGQLTYAERKAHLYEIIDDNTGSSRDPNRINSAGFQFASLDYDIEKIVLPLKQRLLARGESLDVNLCYVDFGPSAFEHSANPEEYAEFMLATFLHIQSKYGWVPDLIEVILEPDNIGFTGTQIGRAVRATITKLSSAGFNPRFVLPSTTSMPNALPYFNAAQLVIGDVWTRQYVAELSYHRYVESIDADNTLKAMAARAEFFGIDTSHLEFIGADIGHLFKDLTLANVSSWAQFALAFEGPDDGSKYFLINSSTGAVTLSSRARYLQQYMRHVRKNAQRIESTSNKSSLQPVAFVNANGKNVIVVRNLDYSATTFSVRGLSAGTYGLFYTSPSQTDVALADITLSSGQPLPVSIAAEAVVTLYQK